MATPDIMSHHSPIDVHPAAETIFSFDSDHELDLSLHEFPVLKNHHLSLMSEPDAPPEIEPQGQELHVPTHPIPSMQAAFAESMVDVFEGTTPAPNPPAGTGAERRKLLLEQDVGEETHAARWKQKPGQRYHELWKLMAQISFGIYLLLNGLARDDEQALTILQTHVDEIDAFLEATLEDFDLAQEDIDDRLKNLKLPLENIHIFDGMLEDRDFRNQIVAGNETIEHIITRSTSAMNDALKNVQQGLGATKEFASYMAGEEQRKEWQEERPEMRRVFEAMKGNSDGWYKAYVSLQTKGNNLGVSLVELGTIVTEIDRRAGKISRKMRFSIAMSTRGSMVAPVASPPRSPPQSSRQSRASIHSGPSNRSRPSIISITKDPPSDPTMITPAIRTTLPAFKMVPEREKSPEPDSSDSEPEFQEPPQYLTLQPRTYTPPPLTPRTYSPAPRAAVRPPTPEPEPDPLSDVPRRSSLRERLSMKRKPTPAPLLQTPSYNSTTSHRSQNSQQSSTSHKSQNSQASQQSLRPPPPADFPRPPPPHSSGSRASAKTGLGPDSAYYSDSSRVVSVVGTPSQEYHQFIASAQPQPRHDFSGYATTPRSDQMHFKPVQASPHSPLQRPWTAAPTPRFPPGRGAGQGQSNSYNGRDSSAQSVFPSNMSQMTRASEVTVGVDAEGKKVKKKRSGFGWLKKAFSLSEEEKREFEEARRRRDVLPVEYGGRREREWLDGRRVQR